LRVFENRVLWRILGPKRDKVTQKWRKLHNEELNDLYSSPKYYTGEQTEKKVIGGTCSTYRGKDRQLGFWQGSLWEGDHLKDPDVGGKIILKWIFRKWDGA
jgi:hypothetical protein